MKNLLSVGLIAAFALFLSSCEEAPEAKFSYTIDANDTKMVTFVNETVGATSYIWQFGDGSTSEEESPVHTYDAGGDYLVALVAQNDQGISEPLIKTIVIVGGGGATVALPSINGADAICVAVNNSTYTSTSGFDVEVQLAAAISVFYDQAGSFVDVGAITVDAQPLEKANNNYYSYYGVGTTTFGSPTSWSVAGGGEFSAITKDVSMGFPTMQKITSGDVTTSTDYMLTFAGDIVGADSMIVIISGANNVYQQTIPVSTGSYTIPQADIANLGATETGVVSVSAYKMQSEMFGTKNVYFVNQGNVVQTVKIL